MVCIFGTYPPSSSSSPPKKASASTAPETSSSTTPKAKEDEAKEKKDEEAVEPLQEKEQLELLPPPYIPGDDEEPAEEGQIVAAEETPGTLQPAYDFKRIFERLPTLATSDQAKARKLLLGLHERFWRAPAMDFRNLLQRCGMPLHVVQLANEVVSRCAICRKYVRASKRPQYKMGLAQEFNDTVQIDNYHWRGNLFLLMIDEATRYKVASILPGRELHQYLQAINTKWIRYFGPMKKLVTDQESCLMTVEAGAELERVGIARIPMRTTSGKEGQKHTGTGLAERHIGLIKITMAKIEAEAAHYGISLEPDDSAAEAAMAQNQTMNFGGYTPSMMLFGVLPRGYFDPEETPLAVSNQDAGHTNLEQAARLRQIALQSAQASILEDRVTRASRSRPEKVDLSQMVVGSTTVEIYREDGNHGWRGPALLLKVNESEGSCIVEYQGRPYLTSLRHIRPFRGSFMIYHSDNKTYDLDDNLMKLQKMVEECAPHKMHIIGQLMKIDTKQHTRQVQQVPIQMTPQDHQVLEQAIAVGKLLTKRFLHGICYGKAMKNIYVPKYSKGILICWPEGSQQMTEHNSDQHLKLKKVLHRNHDHVCFIYFYYYIIYSEEVPPAATSARTTNEAMDVNDNDDSKMDTSENKKRESPETRTVVLAPEKKRQRIEFVISESQLMAKSLWYMAQHRQMIQWEPVHEWWNEHDPELPDPPTSSLATRTPQDEKLLFHYYGKTEGYFHVDLRTQEVFRVDSDTDVLTEEQLAKHWADFEESDFLEIKQFVDEDAFDKMHVNQLTQEMILVDCTWVRKYKRTPEKKMKAKSRQCARGFMDPQKTSMTTRSTTATRLSQRILLSLAAVFQLAVESLDVSGAFLKGLSFNQVKKLLNERGIKSPSRAVVIQPPANVWRHLGRLSDKFKSPRTRSTNGFFGARNPYMA